PGAVEAPWDVFGQSGPEIDLPVGTTSSHPAVNPDEIAAAAALISGARNPMIMVGGGAVDAGAEIASLAELLQSPVTSHRSGKGIVADDHP
ncbi:hypothetical protein ACCS86_37410, partial [Rhizobium ruizarguesonis]